MTRINSKETFKHIPRKVREEIYNEHPDFKEKNLTNAQRHSKFYWKFVQKQDLEFQLYVLNKLKSYKEKRRMEEEKMYKEITTIVQEVIHEAIC